MPVRGRTSKKEGTRRKNSISKSKGRKSSKSYKYYRKLGHLVAECYKLKNKKVKEERNNQSAEASIVNSGSDGDILLVTTTDNRDATTWVLDSCYTYHMCPYRDWFSSYEPLDSSIVLMSNDA